MTPPARLHLPLGQTISPVSGVSLVYSEDHNQTGQFMINTFGKEIIPPNDEARLEALKRYEVLDTPHEEYFDRMARMAAMIFNMPIALVSFVDKERVFFKANVGMPGVENVSRGVSLCALAVLDDDVTVFERPLEEPCLLANPLVTGEFGLRFYAGAPIRTPDGYNIGTLCLVDKKPRYITEDQKTLLADLAGVVADLLVGRLALAKLARNGKASDGEARLPSDSTSSNTASDVVVNFR